MRVLDAEGESAISLWGLGSEVWGCEPSKAPQDLAGIWAQSSSTPIATSKTVVRMFNKMQTSSKEQASQNLAGIWAHNNSTPIATTKTDVCMF